MPRFFLGVSHTFVFEKKSDFAFFMRKKLSITG